MPLLSEICLPLVWFFVSSEYLQHFRNITLQLGVGLFLISSAPPHARYPLINRGRICCPTYVTSITMNLEPGDKTSSQGTSPVKHGGLSKVYYLLMNRIQLTVMR